MIKLLIVDDEPLVQIGIKSMLNWQTLGIEVCGTAMNGQVALDMIREYQPEIVITDIKMPIMNGLELAKTCRDEMGAVPVFIVLTSYEEFQLVREALSYQVVDYLIKLELDADSLTTSVRRALARLEEHRTSQAFKQSGGRPLLQSYNDKFFMRLLHNLFDSRQQFEIQAKDLKLDFGDACYIASHGEIHSDTASQMDTAKQMNLYSSSLQMIREILGKYTPCYVISLDKLHFAVITHFPTMENADVGLIREAQLNACSMVHNYFNVWLTMGTGSSVDDPLKISASYQEARQALNLADRENPVIPFSRITEESIRNSFNITLFREPLTQAFEEFDTDVLYQTMTEITELFSSNPHRYLQAVDGACNILYLALSLLPEGEETLQEIFCAYPDGYRSIYKMKSVVEVIQWLNTFRDGLCDALKNRRKTYKDHVVSNVQKYIANHIEDRLTLNDIAAVFGLSPNYLSALFKKTCNLGFTEYITQKKVARAKTLLLEHDYKVYEVADQLGFESAFYFSKVFKKVEGVSPREYVQSRIQEPDHQDKE
ncbi:MAG: AraC family transcriptional regulator [Eubacteriales bacterium]|nr:AraC family transcriptional regulator [Eubacteriales bacterium]